jgi:hypothetical protein
MRGRPATFSLNLGGRPNQYDLWPGLAERARRGDALVLVLDDTTEPHPVVRHLAPYFTGVRPGAVVELRAPRGVVARRRLWVFTGLRAGWPPAPPSPG